MSTPTNPIIIAIDGYSSSGKSTMARRLASMIGYRYIDSGAMYRAVTLFALEGGLIGEDGTPDADAIAAAMPHISIDFEPQPDGTQHTTLNGVDVENEIRSLRVSDAVSPVAALPAVRRALTDMQKQFGLSKGIVMDGRDIGTAVFPEAELKIFVNAPVTTRARRRYLEMEAKGHVVNYEEILANLAHRDHIDSTRAESPLRQAPDAVVLDNSEMDIPTQEQWLYNQYLRATGQA